MSGVPVPPLVGEERGLVWSRGVARWFRWSLSVAGPFVCRCLTSSAMLPFPHPAHRTGRADLPHPALGEDSRSLKARVVIIMFGSFLPSLRSLCNQVYPGRGADIVMQSLRPTSPNDPVNPKAVDSDLRSLQLGVFGLGSDGVGLELVLYRTCG